jgi:hypothetical protein
MEFSAQHVQNFYRPPELLCAVICCANPPPPPSHHHLSPTLRGISGLSGQEEQGRAPPPHTYHFGQFEAAAVDLEDGLKFGGHEYDG